MRDVLRRLRTWTRADYATLFESLAVAVGVEIALQCVPMTTTLRIIDRVRPRKRTIDWTDDRRARLARFASAPYRVLPVRMTCLRHSLVFCTLLRCRGVAASVRFGVDRRDDALAAHAWVELDGACPDHTGFHELRRAWSA